MKFRDALNVFVAFVVEFGLTLMALACIVTSGFLVSPILGFMVLGVALFLVEWVVDRWPQ